MSIPCNGGIKAPPTMAMTRNAAPREVSSSFSIFERNAVNGGEHQGHEETDAH